MYSKEIRDVLVGMKEWISNGDNLANAMDKIKLVFKAIELLIRVKIFSGIGRMTAALVSQQMQVSAAKRLAANKAKADAAAGIPINTANSTAAAAGPIALSGGTIIPIILGGLATIAAAAASTLMFADGGVVPGTGNQDTVPAMLTPGEVVLNAAQQGAVAGAIGGGGSNQSMSKEDFKDVMGSMAFKVGDQQFAELSADLGANQGNYADSLS